MGGACSRSARTVVQGDQSAVPDTPALEAIVPWAWENGLHGSEQWEAMDPEAASRLEAAFAAYQKDKSKRFVQFVVTLAGAKSRAPAKVRARANFRFDLEKMLQQSCDWGTIRRIARFDAKKLRLQSKLSTGSSLISKVTFLLQDPKYAKSLSELY